MSKRGEATRQMILDKSLALFAEKGFRSVTMKEICEVCSLSRGGLYGHYDSAEQIFLEILKQLPARKHSAMQKRMAQQDAAPDILDEFVETTLQNIEQNQASLFLAICEFFSDPAQNTGWSGAETPAGLDGNHAQSGPGSLHQSDPLRPAAGRIPPGGCGRSLAAVHVRQSGLRSSEPPWHSETGGCQTGGQVTSVSAGCLKQLKPAGGSNAQTSRGKYKSRGFAASGPGSD